MRSVLLFIALISLGSNLLSQGYRINIDTLTCKHRIGGSLDSIDLISGFNMVTFAGAGWNTRNSILDPYFLIENQSAQLFWKNTRFTSYKYSGLPHLGVAYMFGSNAQQFVKAEFQQVFRSNVLLNIRYIKKTSGGILRNSAFNEDDVQLSLRHTGRLYSFDLHSSYERAKIEQSGGIIADSLAELYSLPFIPVNRSSSELQTKRSRVLFDQYFDFVKDSSLAFGICTESALNIKNFKLNESDTLYGLYPIINYDSLKTKDQHQWSSISGGAGIFFSRGAGSIKVIPMLNYWNFQNLGRFMDTTELSLMSRINYYGKRWEAAGNVFYTFQGARNEWNEDFYIKYKLNNVVLDLKSEIQFKLPDYYQRYALGNSTLPIIGDWEKQLRSHHMIRVIKSNKKLYWDMNFSHTLLQQNYFFIDSVWRNDSLTKLSFFELGTTVGFHHKAFNAQLHCRLTKNDGMESIIPAHQLFSRVYLKGGLFKARKMISYTGIEMGYLSPFNSIGYLPQLGGLSFAPTGKEVPEQLLLHYYAGFQIDEFKFFFRLENIHLFWSNRTLQQVSGYPVTPLQIKLGITWDFFD